MMMDLRVLVLWEETIRLPSIRTVIWRPLGSGIFRCVFTLLATDLEFASYLEYIWLVWCIGIHWLLMALLHI